MNRRLCPFCKQQVYFGSSPYGATCLNCGMTDPRAFDRENEVTRMVAQRGLAIVLLITLAYVLTAASQWPR